ncbi:MAG: sugar-binding transcriptional regulator, partial [Anaerolineae bacterium]|nr:sugar-binding transcriptional regulator [Anaerolineae bacterium]
APGIASNQQVKAALLSDNFIQQGLETLNHVTVAYIGIGVPSPNSVVMRDGSIITQAELDDLLAKGAVGDIALRFFDAHGQPIASNVDDRVIGITLTQLQRIDRVVGVTGGPQKETVVRGSLEGQLIDVLITDQMLAARLLE